jgi:hypothetical protein
LLAACGTHDPDDEVDCAKVTGTDTFVVGFHKAGALGAIDFKMMSAEPAPPARGDNTWLFEIASMSSGVVGAPIDGASFVVTPFMPAHEHGAKFRTEITPAGQPGQYTLTPVNLWMPGVWETTVRATSGTTTDSAIFKFCIE